MSYRPPGRRRTRAEQRVVRTFRVDATLWDLAQDTADQVGVSIGSVIERQLLDFVRSASTVEEATRYVVRLPKRDGGVVR